LNREDFYQRGEVELDDAQARRLVGRYVTGAGIRVVRVSTQDDQVRVRLEQSVDLAFAPPGWSTRTVIVAEATAQLRLGE
ncbi:MAG: hypothetical protein JWP31_1989, partial [Aeromicrobium sp.]|nr:hypothetical protein [Aeromicrobium sp.]